MSQNIVKKIRRASRCKFTAEEKTQIVLELEVQNRHDRAIARRI